MEKIEFLEAPVTMKSIQQPKMQALLGIQIMKVILFQAAQETI